MQLVSCTVQGIGREVISLEGRERGRSWVEMNDHLDGKTGLISTSYPKLMAGFHRFDNSIVNIFQLYLIKCFGNKGLCVAFFLRKVVMYKFLLKMK